MAKDIIVPIAMQSIDASTIGAGAYTEVGDPIEGALLFLRITNASNTAVIFSTDGITEHEYIPAGKSISVYFQPNAIGNNEVAKLPKGTIFNVKGTAGVGLVYFSGYYNE